MLKGRSALVTGSTAGLGRAIAERLAGEGCNIVLNGFGEAGEIEAQRRALEADHGVAALHHGADLARPDAIAEMMAAATEAFGGIDILVNNAVVRHFAPVDAFPVERWDAALAVNLSAAFHTIRLAVPGMRARNWGRIVNIASVFGFFAVKDRVDYVTTKTGLIGLTRAVALDVVGDGITCNAICPGAMHTPAIESRLRAIAEAEGVTREQAIAGFLSTRQPSRRFIAPEGVAALVCFLCSPEARDITAAALPVDSGWTAT
jgi:3-hydroxybutyrate dehydrogenase